MRTLGWYLLLLCLFLTSVSQAKLEVYEYDQELDISGDRVSYRNALFSGDIYLLYPDGTRSMVSHYERGLQSGPTIQTAIGGARMAQMNYKKGLLHGNQLGWYVEGPKKFSLNYVNGEMDGEQIEWHLNGEVLRRRVFVKGEEVSRKILYANSDIYTNYTYKDRRKYGIDGGDLCFEKKRDGEK